MDLKINCFGFVGSLSIFALVIISLFVPWWHLSVGDDLLVANASPLNTNFSFIGDSLTIPLIMALNIASLISLSAAGIVMFIYSLKPLKPYSTKLLGFAYKKPLYSVVLFVAGLVIMTIIMRSFFGFDVPLLGSQLLTLPSDMTQGVKVSVFMTAGFQWPFVFAIIGVGLCIAAKIYHKKIVPTNHERLSTRTPRIIHSVSSSVVLKEL